MSILNEGNAFGSLQTATPAQSPAGLLRLNPERLNSILENSRDGITLLDLAAAQYVYINQAQVEMTGFTLAELLSMPLDTLCGRVHPDDRMDSLEYQRMLASGQDLAKDLVYRWQTKCGEYRWFSERRKVVRDASGLPVSIVGILRDITEQKHNEDVLKTSGEQLRLAMLSARISSWIVDLTSGEVTNSSNFAQVMGFPDDSPALLSTENMARLVLPEDIGQLRNIIATALINDDSAHAEFRIVNPLTGEIIWLDSQCVIIRDSSHHPVLIVGIHRNETESKIAEQKLRTSEEQALVMVEKLRLINDNKNAFLSTLSHELRNPLAAISMGLSLLQRQIADAVDVHKVLLTLDLMNRQTSLLTHLVDDLLDVTRITRKSIVLHKQTVDLCYLLGQIVADHQVQFNQKGVHLRLELALPWTAADTVSPAPLALMLDADPMRLTQVFGNLLHNALKFTAQGGETVISLAIDEMTQEAVVKVCDNGIGMDVAALQNVFEPYMQIDQSLNHEYGGLGLGLVIAKSLVDLHGGQILVDSAGLGRGTQITVRLPLLQRVTRVPAWVPPLAIGRNQALRILIIEDNLDLNIMLQECLQSLGYQVQSAVNGLDGIALAGAFRPDVIICDIGLPGLSGFEVARAIRRDHPLPNVFLIAYSGYAQPEDLDQSKAAGFNRHLVKPLNISALINVLAEVQNDLSRLD